MNKFFTLVITVLVFSHYVSANSLSLDQFLQKAKNQNLDYKIEQNKYEISQAEAIGIRLPAPKFSWIQMKEGSNSNMKGFEVSMDVPFPTTIGSDYFSRKYSLKSQEHEFYQAQNQTLLSARLLYIELWKSQETIKLLRQKKQILAEHIKLTKASARSDTFTTMSLLKSEADLEMIENEILVAEQEFLEKNLEVLRFLNEEDLTNRYEASEPPLSDVPELLRIEDTFQYKAQHYKLESLKSKESKAMSNWLPELMLKYREVDNSTMTSKTQETMLGITLPFVFFWQPYSEVVKAKRERRIEEYQLQSTKRRIESDQIALIEQAKSLKKQLSNLKEKIIPRAEKRLKYLNNIDYRDMATLEDHRSTMESIPELKMKALDIRIKYERIVNNLLALKAKKEKSDE